MIEIIDSDMEDKLEEKMLREEAKSKTRLTLPRKLDHLGVASSKYYLQDLNKQSPTFSPLNSLENKRNLLNQNSNEAKKLQERSSVKLNQFAPTSDAVGQRYKSRYLNSKDIPPAPKPYEFSPYNQRGMLRKARHSSYFNGKQNLSNLNYTSSHMKHGEPSMMEDHYKFRETNNSHILSESEELAELKAKYKHSHKENQELKGLINQLRLQLKQSKERQSDAERLLLMIRRQCGEDILNTETCCNFIKKCQRNDALVGSIIDMKTKITGKPQNNLKELWRWLKSIVQDLSSKREVTTWLKEDYLRISRDEPDQMIRLKLLERMKR